ncbi:MAG: hypothetical protein JWM86_46 [Thermoleophilia bacterium]|nr:hypothetical protein [Thermoleophilia bacterium]
MASLDERLQQLATTIVVPREEDGTPATLVALMPCEPAIGEVAVACWTDRDGGELVELVRLEDGSRVDDSVALRESLTLLAMVETVEELASFDELAPLAAALAAWHGSDDAPDTEAFSRARASAAEAVTRLAALSPGEAARVARPQLLDAIGGAIRDLEKHWEQLEQQAELWSDTLLAGSAGDTDALARVQALWTLLGVARRGPLARPVSSALTDGREAGLALATAVNEASRAS